MFGSLNVLEQLYSTEYSAVDVLATLGINAGLTMYACESETFRLPVPMIGQKIEEMVGDKYGWLGDARFMLGAVSALAAQFGTKVRMDGTQMIPDRVGRLCHDFTAGALTSLVSTEICRSKSETEAGGKNMHSLGFDDSDFGVDDLLDDDLTEMEEYQENGESLFALAW